MMMMKMLQIEQLYQIVCFLGGSSGGGYGYGTHQKGTKNQVAPNWNW